ncbi:MAG: sialate O-acetylesterase, partial [Bacteroidales bacterium]
MKKIFFFLSLGIVLISCTSEPKIRLTCIGDSITEGAGVKDLSKHSYPSVLSAKLGEKYDVLNCGQGGATMLQMGDLPYVSTNEWYNAQMFHADITVIA